MTTLNEAARVVELYRSCVNPGRARLVSLMGLDRIDRRLLETIVRVYRGGPVGLETLAAATSEEKETIEDLYEPYLMQIGFLQRTPRGRTVTSLAYRHLGIEEPRAADETQQSLF